MRQLRIGICGLGTVGSGTFNLIRSSADEITRKTGVELVIQHVGCRRDHPDCDLSGVKVSRDIFEVAKDPEVDVLLELIGGTDTAKELVTSALENGKHVVTANKALIALEGMPVMELAKQKGVALKFEAAIAGGIPIVKALFNTAVSFTSNAQVLNAITEFGSVFDVCRSNLGYTFRVHRLKIRRCTKRHGSQQCQFVGCVNAFHIKGGVGFGIT